MSSPPVKVVGYVRVSTEEQARDGVSLRAQDEKIRGYAALYNLELVAVLVDGGQSGKSLDRPALREALGRLDRGEASGLLVAKLDRLTRSVRDLADLIETYFGEGGGAQLFSVADAIDTRTAAGRLVLNVLMSVAQWERETIVERTQTVMDYKRTKGERLGTIPYGYELDPAGPRNRDGNPIGLRANDDERKVLALVRQWRDLGTSYRGIAERLNEIDAPTRRGGAWSASTVAGILARADHGAKPAEVEAT